MIPYQKTIGREIEYDGTGLHSGESVTLILKPAPVDTGIVFIRTDLEGHPSVQAHINNVTNTMRATTLENGPAKVFTVEHILSAFYGLGISNCYVEMDSAEPPIGDGSSLTFVELIEKASIVAQEKEVVPQVVMKCHRIYDGDRYVMVVPYDGLRVSFTSINSHPQLGTQFCDVIVTPETYKTEIAKARTVGFMHEIEELHKMGLAKGGTLDNCIVYDDEKCLSQLRYDDELVRHKILDILGDISLLGPIKGHIIALKSSHALNAQLSRLIVKEFEA